MKTLRTPILLAACLPLTPAWAHEGHGLLGPHWHASDLSGLLAVAAIVVVGAALWCLRK